MMCEARAVTIVVRQEYTRHRGCRRAGVYIAESRIELETATKMLNLRAAWECSTVRQPGRAQATCDVKVYKAPGRAQRGDRAVQCRGTDPWGNKCDMPLEAMFCTGWRGGPPSSMAPTTCTRSPGQDRAGPTRLVERWAQ